MRKRVKHRTRCRIFFIVESNMKPARPSENYLAISRSSSASKSVEIFWAEIYWGGILLRAESGLIQSSCRSFIRVIVPCEISKVNFRVETKILVSMSVEI